jgi:C4-dicarboxylate transporter
MMGTMYGVNMIFQGFAPLMVGVIVAWFGFNSLFIYVASMNGLGLLLVVSLLPVLMRRKRTSG